jgi:glucose-6-phosphate isomerase
MADAVGSANGVTPDDLLGIQGQVRAAHDQLQKWRASKDAIFMDYPFEVGLASRFRKSAGEVQNGFDNLVVLGIGGSSLGLRCIAGALLPPYANLLERKKRGNAPKLFVCDNIDPETFGTLLEYVDLKETCFNVISKSGGTTETMSQLFVVLPMLKARLGRKWKEHLYVTTDPEAGPLRKFVVEEDLSSFDVPPKLGGRFSVLSAVGLFPAACLGLDIEGILDGARAMARQCAGTDLDENPAYKNSAIDEIMSTKKGKKISVLMSYADRLSLLADWYVQLFAESLGKDGKGMTPLKAVGSTDQHSQIQLFMEGPNDKLITIIGLDEFSRSVPVMQVMTGFEQLQGHDLGKILNVLRDASSQALVANHRPVIGLTIPQVTPQAIGELFMFYEISTAFSGAMMGVNPFDQPGVELGKKLAKQILQEK